MGGDAPVPLGGPRDAAKLKLPTPQALEDHDHLLRP
jgi:hypothetical protein